MTQTILSIYKYFPILPLYLGIGAVGLFMPQGYASNPEISLAIVVCLISNNKTLPVVGLSALLLQFVSGISQNLGTSELFIQTVLLSLSVVFQCYFVNKVIRLAIGGRWKSLYQLEDLIIACLISVGLSSLIPATTSIFLSLLTGSLDISISVATWVSNWVNNATNLSIFLPMFLAIYLRKSYGWRQRWKPIVMTSSALTVLMLVMSSSSFGVQRKEQEAAISKIGEKIIFDFELQNQELQNNIETFTKIVSAITNENNKNLYTFSQSILEKYPEISSISVSSYLLNKNRTEHEIYWSHLLSMPNYKIRSINEPHSFNGVKERKQYLPVTFIHSRDENVSELGTDLLSNSTLSGKYVELIQEIGKKESGFKLGLINDDAASELKVISAFDNSSLENINPSTTEENIKIISTSINKNKYLHKLLENISTEKFLVSIQSNTLDSGTSISSKKENDSIYENIEIKNSRHRDLLLKKSIQVFNEKWEINLVPKQSWFYSRLLSTQIPTEAIRLLMLMGIQMLIFVIMTKKSGIKLLVAKQTATILNRERNLRIFRESIQKSTDLIMICKVDKLDLSRPKIQYVNDFFEIRTGYVSNEIFNKDWSILQNEETDQNTIMNIRQALNDGLAHSVELLSFTKSGEWLWLKVNISPIKNNNHEITHWVFIQHEITERIISELLLKKSAEEAQSSNQAKSRFLASMSHEIRTPLGGIIGLTRLALLNSKEKHTTEYLETILISAELQLKILSDILDFSKIEADSLVLNISTFDLEELLQESVALFQPSAFLSGLELNLSLSINRVQFVYGDWLRLKQVIANLISNAIKFTDKGSVELKVDTLDFNDSEVTLRISVIDTGVGIKGLSLSELIEPFKQAHHTNTRNYQSTGLGLTISDQLLRLMGSNLQLKPRFGGTGSCFYFDLILPISINSNELLTSTSESLSRKNLKSDLSAWKNVFTGKTILVAEDNKVTQLVARQHLEITGAKVDIASDGQAAIKLFSSNHYDLILMDLQMPGINGLLACKTIRKLEGGSTIPIFGMSAGITSNEADACQDAGMNDFLHKPIEPNLLFSKIEFYLGKSIAIEGNEQEKNQLTDRGLSEKSKNFIVSPNLRNGVTAKDFGIQHQFLLTTFLYDVVIIQYEILEKIRNSEYESAQKILHEIQGSAAIMGETEVVTTAKNLEKLMLTKTKDRHVIDRFISALKKCQNNISASLTKENNLTTITSQEDENHKKVLENQALGEYKRDSFKILIADDNELVRISLQQLLLGPNIKVECVSSGEEVLKQLLVTAYDIILMDINMKGLDGISTTRQIRVQTIFAHIHIIGMSADVSEKIVKKCIDAGMQEVYSKHSRPEVLFTLIQKITHN